MIQSMLIPKEITDRPEWLNAVTRAGEWIVQVLGKWESNKHFSWVTHPGPGQNPVFELRVEAEGGSVSGRFTWFELNDEKTFKDRVTQLWGNLIDQVMHSQVEDLKRLRDEWKQEAAVATQD